ncbi:IclR family transcriptional regulator [Mumia flava]|uniref:IclR family transcriptional regulator n=1 Tax=Mumia flava TaxID=1348852 RepID=UPI000C2380A6|nr:IclR family transcriptional regulator [Mumia flava]
MTGRRSGGEAPTSLATKALTILASFTPERPRLTLSELARESGLALTTTHRVVGDLLAWGALERGSDGAYQIGLRLWETASLAPRGTPLREVALPYMEDLYEATHENVQLAVREDLEVVYVERLTGRGAVRVLTRVGGRFALHATGVGLVLLAHAPTDVQEEALAGPLRRWTDLTITDPARLRAVLAEVRRTGVAVSDRQVTVDALSVACPVHGRGDRVLAALSVVVHADTPVHAVRPAVQAAARGMSRALGAPSALRRPEGIRPRPSRPRSGRSGEEPPL